MSALPHAGTTQHKCYGCGHVFMLRLFTSEGQTILHLRCPECNRRVARCECGGIAFCQRRDDRSSRCERCKLIEERGKNAHSGIPDPIGLDGLKGWQAFELDMRRAFKRFAKEHFLPQSSMRDLIEQKYNGGEQTKYANSSWSNM